MGLTDPTPFATFHQVPDGKKQLFLADGTVVRVIGEFIASDSIGSGRDRARPYLIVETIPANGVGRRFAISKYELGRSLNDPDSHKPPVRKIAGRIAPDAIQPVTLPPQFFTDGPTIGATKDCIQIAFSANILVHFVVYYGVKISSQGVYGYPPYYGPNIPPTAGPELYPFPYLYGGGGYDAVHPVRLLDTDHSVEICGLLPGRIYNVVICIFDRDNRGPVCSQNFEIQIPTA